MSEDGYERPPLGEIKIGDEVIVREGYSGRTYRAKIEKVARVWVGLVEITDNPRPLTWHLRKDTQDDGMGSARRTRFLTPAQAAWEKREREARDFLERQGILLTLSSPWLFAGQNIRLAEIVKAAIEDES